MTPSYPTNLTQDQWELLEPLLPAAKPGSRPRSTNLQAVINAILYMLCAGCAWHLLPNDFPKWKTVYHYFRAWRLDGTWVEINHRLHQWVRVVEDRATSPSAAILNSQSVKSAMPAAIEVGFDAAKPIKGRKRHLSVDTLGLMLMIVMTAASVPERAGAKLLLARLHQVRHWFTCLVVIWVNGGFCGLELHQWVMDTYRWVIETVVHSEPIKGFIPLRQRWKVERTFGWFHWCRRLSKDYEILPETAGAFV